MLHGRQNNDKIKHLNERCLRRIQNEKLPDMTRQIDKLLEKDGAVSFSHRNTQNLDTEILQIKHGQSREIVTDIFIQTTEEYNFRQ